MNDNGFPERSMSGEMVGDETPGFDTFLRDEGLELLKNYRSIEDEDVRRSLRSLIAMIAADRGSKPKLD